MDTPDITLFTLPETFGLASMSPAGVAVETYLRAMKKYKNEAQSASVPSFEVQSVTSGQMSPSGELPFLRDTVDVGGEEILVSGTAAMLDHLRKYLDLDTGLSQPQRAELFAFLGLIENRLVFALDYHWWCQEVNYQSVIRPTVASWSPWPLSWILPKSQQRNRRQALSAANYLDADRVYSNAEDCLAALSARLGAGPYFFGTRPTSLDCIAYAFVSAARDPALPDPTLTQLVNEYPALAAFCDRIRADLYPDLGPAPSHPYSGPLLKAFGEADDTDSSWITQNPYSVRHSASGAGTGAGHFTAGGSAPSSVPAGAGNTSSTTPNDSSSFVPPRRRKRESMSSTATAASTATTTTTNKSKSHRSPKEERFRSRTRWALAFAAASVGLYALYGTFPQVHINIGSGDDDDDDEYDEDD